jgi:alpha-1,4-glucan:alpha-1,4-glucan 6-glycosyltransferase/4-alpha-glucanotransferase
LHRVVALSDEIATLHELAADCGVSVRWHDVVGTEHVVAPESLTEVLRAFGVDISGPGDAADALAARRAQHARRVVEPVIVAWDDNPVSTTLWHSPGHADRLADCQVRREDGVRVDWRIRIGDLPIVDVESFGRSQRVGRRLDVPAVVPIGNHRLDIVFGGQHHTSTVVVAPTRGAASGPSTLDGSWGLISPVFALRGARGGAPGDIGHLGELAELGGRYGAAVIATLPMLAAFLDEPMEVSPYLPVSRRFWNELYIDLERVPELMWSPAAAARLGDPARRAERRTLRDATRIDYAAAALRHREILELLSAALARSPTERSTAFRNFVADHPEVAKYARFRAAGERLGTNWRAWPARMRDGVIGFTDIDPTADSYHRYVQWIAHEQLGDLARKLERRGQVLALDLPLGCHPSGYDIWASPHTYATAQAGAPPDPFAATGQAWGFPPVHPETARLDGHAGFRACLMQHFEFARVLRIDHVMGFHRQWWVPHGADPTQGAYVRYPAEELWALVCLEASRAGAAVVGENLGTVSDDVEEALHRHGARGIAVAQFRADPYEFTAPARSVAMWGTHDMPTFAGWHAMGEETAVARGELRDVFDGFLTALAESEADIVMVGLDDLSLEPSQQNEPGTVKEQNWRVPARTRIDEIGDDPAVRASLGILAERRGRVAPPSPEPGDTSRALSLLGELDVHLFNEGRHRALHTKLGAHTIDSDGTRGTVFAVWAPDAAAVSVIGDFNAWEGGRHPLHPVGESGIWEAFLPGVGRGAIYKYLVTARFGGHQLEKADPFAFHTEVPPRTASIVWDLDYEWRDAAWMARRAEAARIDRPMSIYEVHLGSWARVPEEGDRWLTYREIAPLLADHVERLGFTHVELMPVMEHPFYGSWGYQITGYFAPTARYGTPQDLMYLINHLHERDIGVILDWVPSHFPSDAHGLAFFDGTHLYEHADPRQRIQPDWQSYQFNYGRNEVRSFLTSNALFWLELYHADGLRTDAVASMLYLDYSRDEGEWIPNRYGGREHIEAVELLRSINAAVGQHVPDAITFAEESTSWPGVTRTSDAGGLGFWFKWDMGWMNDALRHFRRDPVHRNYHLDDLTFRMLYADTEQYVLPLSHDEVVHGKGSLLGRMPGDDWQQFANLRLLLGYQHGMSGKKLLFQGGELASREEWDHERSLPWHLLDAEAHAGVMRWVALLNRLHRSVPALHERDCGGDGFEWIDCTDRSRAALAWLRSGHDRDDPVAIVANLTPAPRDSYLLGVPCAGMWEVIADSDDRLYWGSGYRSLVPDASEDGELGARDQPAQGRPYSVALSLPPLAIMFLRRKLPRSEPVGEDR